MKLFKLLIILIIHSYAALALTPINCPATAPGVTVNTNFDNLFVQCDDSDTNCTAVKLRTFVALEEEEIADNHIASLENLNSYPLFTTSSISLSQETISTENLTSDGELDCVYANEAPSALIAEIAKLPDDDIFKLFINSDNYTIQVVGEEPNLTFLKKVSGNMTVTLETDDLEVIIPDEDEDEGEDEDGEQMRFGDSSGSQRTRLTIKTTEDGETDTHSFDIKMNFSCTGSDCNSFSENGFVGNLVETELCEGEEHTGDVYGLELYRTTNSTTPVGYIKLAMTDNTQTQIFKITENDCLEEL